MDKSHMTHEAKKVGRSLKEKQAEKRAARAQERASIIPPRKRPASKQH